MAELKPGNCSLFHQYPTEAYIHRYSVKLTVFSDDLDWETTGVTLVGAFFVKFGFLILHNVDSACCMFNSNCYLVA
ncbi:hypothetical protein CCP3SC1_40080 [Gammaproteobacteria bacterium]